MRNTFAKTLLHLARHDSRIMLLTGDLGYSVFEEYRDTLPKQYLNAGVAEQNMTGVAAGLAIEGYVPIIYSIIPFVTMRNFEQIRNDICYQNLNVKIVGVGAGFSYGPYGHTHHGLEDIGILRTLPTMTIIAPGDPTEVRLATEGIMEHEGPCYLRIGKTGEPVLYKKDPVFTIGKGIVISQGNDITIISASTMLERTFRVRERLEKAGISTRAISMHTIKPIDRDLIVTSMKKTNMIVTIEEHSIIGGLGSAVAEIVAESAISKRLIRLGVPDVFTQQYGRQEFMREKNGLSEHQIFKTIQEQYFITQKQHG